jgi:hypothetical protein
VRRGREEGRDKVLFFGVEVDHANAAALLLAELVGVGALNIAALRSRRAPALRRHQVLDIDDACGALHHLGCAVVAILFGNVGRSRL